MTKEEKLDALEAYCNTLPEVGCAESGCVIAKVGLQSVCTSQEAFEYYDDWDDDVVEALYSALTHNQASSDKREPEIKDSGERTEFATGAVRDMHEGKGRMDLLPWLAIIELSKHCENGAKKYGEHNVDKGIPVHSFYDSAMRHLAKHISGMTDERHDIAALWNIAFAIQTAITHPELNDIPWRSDDG